MHIENVERHIAVGPRMTKTALTDNGSASFSNVLAALDKSGPMAMREPKPEDGVSTDKVAEKDSESTLVVAQDDVYLPIPWGHRIDKLSDQAALLRGGAQQVRIGLSDVAGQLGAVGQDLRLSGTLDPSELYSVTDADSAQGRAPHVSALETTTLLDDEIHAHPTMNLVPRDETSAFVGAGVQSDQISDVEQGSVTGVNALSGAELSSMQKDVGHFVVTDASRTDNPRQRSSILPTISTNERNDLRSNLMMPGRVGDISVFTKVPDVISTSDWAEADLAAFEASDLLGSGSDDAPVRFSDLTATLARSTFSSIGLRHDPAILALLRESVLLASREPSHVIELDTGSDVIGKLRLTIQSQDGTLQVTLLSGRPEALEILRRTIGVFLRDLSAQGFHDVDVHLSPQDLGVDIQRGTSARLLGGGVSIDGRTPDPYLRGIFDKRL